MALDPFEGRMIFLQMLGKLNASQQSQQTLAAFAVKNAALEEDLYSCILEVLESTTLNARVNIFYFLETLCEYSRKAHVTFHEMVAHDIARIVDLVAPQGSKAGSANLSTAREVLASLRAKNYVAEADAAALDERLLKRLEEEASVASAKGDGGEAGSEREQFSRKDILRRMDEDRERHKKLRESIWSVPVPTDRSVRNPEFEMQWDSVSDWDRDDYENGLEEDAQVRKAWALADV